MAGELISVCRQTSLRLVCYKVSKGLEDMLQEKSSPLAIDSFMEDSIYNAILERTVTVNDRKCRACQEAEELQIIPRT